MLTESQAWALIADASLGKVTTDLDNVDFYQMIYKSEKGKIEVWCSGLCLFVDLLEEDERISIETKDSMKQTIVDKAQAEKAYRAFIWPRTYEGQRQRQAFAREMAKLTEEK